MADAEDLKSSGDFSSCGFDSHPGHHFSSLHSSVYVVMRRTFLLCFSFGASLDVPNFGPTRDAANTRLIASAFRHMHWR